MTVIQPIFYGGSGLGDVRLKSLKPQYNSITLFKNHYIDFTVTPELDLSKEQLYEVSCDDPRVIIEHRGSNNWYIQMPNEKIPETVTTHLHFRATDGSDISVDVPLTLQAGLDYNEAREWFNSHTSPKQLTPSFEPVSNWQPFKEYSSGAEIIARAIRDNKRYMINVGDYFEETVNGTTYRWTIAEFNHYRQNEALMIPDRLMPSSVLFSRSGNTYTGSTLESVFNSFYDAMPYSLKPYVQNMYLPWTDFRGEQGTVTEHVFPPSEIEAFGTTRYSKESSSSYRQWACFTDNSRRARAGRSYWLRSTYNNESSFVPIVDGNGLPDWFNGNKNEYGALPCFCIA